MLGLICDSGEVRGLFCKVVDARGLSPPWVVFAWAAPRAAARSRAHYVKWATRVGHAGEFVFLFHKELEIVF